MENSDDCELKKTFTLKEILPATNKESKGSSVALNLIANGVSSV